MLPKIVSKIVLDLIEKFKILILKLLHRHFIVQSRPSKSER
jgi:hypothetical protein